MMRKKHITPTIVDEKRQAVADFLGLDYANVIPNGYVDCYTINITDNKEAQDIFKKSYPYGNTNIPNKYDFSKPIDIHWNGSKVLPA